MSVDPVVLLELEKMAPLGGVLNFWVEEIRIFDVPAVEVLVPGGETHFGIGDHRQEKTVLAPPDSVVAKWLAKAARWSTRCRTELRVGCYMIVLSGTAYILPLTILVIKVTVSVIATTIAPFLS